MPELDFCGALVFGGTIGCLGLPNGVAFRELLPIEGGRIGVVDCFSFGTSCSFADFGGCVAGAGMPGRMLVSSMLKETRLL
jgi:hypothetical protein